MILARNLLHTKKMMLNYRCLVRWGWVVHAFSVNMLLAVLVWLTAGLLLSTPAFSATAKQEDGAALAQRIYDRADGKDLSTRAMMMLTEKGHSPRKRNLFTYAIDLGKGEKWSLTRFTKPTDIDGTGLLTKDHSGGDSDQKLYLPALDKVRRIVSSRKGGRFVGSDLFYEDLRDREVDMDHHRLAGKGKAGGQMCDILISTPVDPENSVYSKRVGWIHPKTLVPLRIDYYKKNRKKPIKRMRVRKLKKIQGYWTVLDSIMYDLKTGHKTRIVTKAVKYDQGIPAALFSDQALADDSRERRFRP